MPTNIVRLTPGYYPSSSIGRPLASADIYVGIPDLDPEIVANQKTLSVQQEDGTVVAVSQPISTNAGGVPQYLGSPVTLLVEGDYSLKVLDSAGSQIYYVPSLASQALIPGNYFYPDYNETDQGAAGDGNSVFDILTEVGAVTKATMYFAHNSGAATTTYVFGTDETITDNFNIIVEDGALLSPSTGKTLTVAAPLNPGAYQIFSGAGTITISSVILEHDQWRDGAGDDILPSVDNAIDLGSSAQEFKDLYIDGKAYLDAINFNGTDISATAAEINTVADGAQAKNTHVHTLQHRSKFRWKDGDEIYIGAGGYFHDGTTRQTVFWDAEITFVLQSGGSNSDSDDYGADGWHYIYLDDSAIITNGSPELVANCFLNETTAPTWSAAKHGWYNGSDRCISATYETGGAIIEFFHEGDTVYNADLQVAFANADPTTAFVDLDLSAFMPGFSVEAILTGTQVYIDGNGTDARWRTNGQTGSTGHHWSRVTDTADSDRNTFTVITDSSQVIEHMISAGNNTVLINFDAWKFPIGM